MCKKRNKCGFLFVCGAGRLLCTTMRTSICVIVIAGSFIERTRYRLRVPNMRLNGLVYAQNRGKQIYDYTYAQFAKATIQTNKTAHIYAFFLEFLECKELECYFECNRVASCTEGTYTCARLYVFFFFFLKHFTMACWPFTFCARDDDEDDAAPAESTAAADAILLMQGFCLLSVCFARNLYTGRSSGLYNMCVRLNGMHIFWDMTGSL